MSIGNSINSLPLAYAPLNGTGRYVAYALASPTAESTATSAGLFIGDLAGVLAATGGLTPVGNRFVPASVTAEVTAALSSIGFRVFDETVAAAVSAAVAALGGKTKASAVTVMAALAAISSAVPLRVRSAKSDFTSLYIPPGVRSSTPAVNSFSLNIGAINSIAGQFRRVFETLCAPTGSFIVALSVSLDGEAGQTPTGNPLFGGFATVASEAAAAPLPNAIFDPDPTLAGLAAVAPSGGPLLATGGTFEQDSATAVLSGSLIVGPSKTLAVESAGVFTPLFIGIGSSAMDVTGALAAVAKLIADGAFSEETLSEVTLLGGRARSALLTLAVQSIMDGEPWAPLSVAESIVYADAWDAALGFVLNEDTLYLEYLESIIYRTELETIVYGEMD